MYDLQLEEIEVFLGSGKTMSIFGQSQVFCRGNYFFQVLLPLSVYVRRQALPGSFGPNLGHFDLNLGLFQLVFNYLLVKNLGLTYVGQDLGQKRTILTQVNQLNMGLDLKFRSWA